MASGVMLAPKVGGKFLSLFPASPPGAVCQPLHPGAVVAPSPSALADVGDRAGVVPAGDPA